MDRNLVVACLMLVCGMVSAATQGATITVAATDDVYVQHTWRWPQVNGYYYTYNTATTMDLLYNNGSTIDWRYGYVKYDLSAIPSWAIITGITLNARATSSAYLGTFVNVAYVSNDSWTQDTLYYNNQPAASSTLATTATWTSDSDTLWMSTPLNLDAPSWDVTTDQADGQLSLQLFNPTSTPASLRTREYLPAGSDASTLTITYVPEPANAATLLLLAGTSLFVRRRVA